MTPVGAASTNARGEGANAGAFPGNRWDEQNMLLAYQIQKALLRQLGSEDRGVRRARFEVLREATMPAALIEAGFLSHPTEGKKIFTAEYRRQMVFYRTNEPAGTIVVHTAERFLYLVQGGNRAIRYGIGVGRDGFQWSGLKHIVRKAEWPDWVPPPEMIERQPYLPRFMAGGAGNPMGARALYIGGTVYRIHGTNQPQTIGSAVSSGCFRLTNPEVIDLYERVPVGTKVVVLQRAQL